MVIRTKRIFKRSIPIVALLAFTIFSLVLTSPTLASNSSQQANTTFTVLAGYEDVAADGLEIEAFLPEDVTIKAGDTVNWKFTVLEPHTVTFLGGQERPAEFIELPDGRLAFNPAMILPGGDPAQFDGTGFINSGFQPEDAGPDGYEFALTFPQPGTFPYVCLLHPFMTGTVTVLPDTAPPVFSPEVVLDNADFLKDEFVEDLNELREQLGPPQSIRRAGRITERMVRAGISTQKVDLMHFDRPNINIFVDDTVTWTWEATGAPHNVLFLPEGEENPSFLTVEPQEAGPPNFLFNPDVFDPAGGDTFDPGAVHNSGVRFNPAVPAPPGFASGATYSLTFPETGTYTYLCSLHFAQGMTGTITVRERFPLPPNVGDFAPGPLMGAVAGVVGLSLISGGGLLLRRRLQAQRETSRS